MSSEDDDREWEVGWEGHTLAQQRRLARLTLIEKLAWLEEAQRVMRHLRRPDTGADAASEGLGPPSPEE